MKKKTKKILIATIVSILILLAVFLPLPYYIELPGSAENII